MADELTMAQKVQIHNERELARSWKLFRVRVGFCLLFCSMAASSLAVAGQDGILIAFPLAGIALIFLILALDCHSHCRAVSERRWTALTPRFSRRRAPSSAGQDSASVAANPEAV